MKAEQRGMSFGYRMNCRPWGRMGLPFLLEENLKLMCTMFKLSIRRYAPKSSFRFGFSCTGRSYRKKQRIETIHARSKVSPWIGWWTSLFPEIPRVATYRGLYGRKAGSHPYSKARPLIVYAKSAGLFLSYSESLVWSWFLTGCPKRLYPGRLLVRRIAW
ncbi:MAG: hypothetical protein PWP47_1482 [Synergistaceae bacterium]|nr:hypothetical protein [Synergistaceae bacterium]